MKTKSKLTAEMRENLAKTAKDHVAYILEAGGTSPTKLARECDPIESWGREKVLEAAGVADADEELYAEIQRCLISHIRARALDEVRYELDEFESWVMGEWS